eukprot:Hpha_TRINITY_DN14628_c0_g4::TRINITY_DN14628_c0_g4_i1::g.47732::m.47732
MAAWGYLSPWSSTGILGPPSAMWYRRDAAVFSGKATLNEGEVSYPLPFFKGHRQRTCEPTHSAGQYTTGTAVRVATSHLGPVLRSQVNSGLKAGEGRTRACARAGTEPRWEVAVGSQRPGGNSTGDMTTGEGGAGR